MERWTRQPECVSPSAIASIADDRVVNSFEVDTNLMGASSVEFAGEQADLGLRP